MRVRMTSTATLLNGRRLPAPKTPGERHGERNNLTAMILASLARA